MTMRKRLLGVWVLALSAACSAKEDPPTAGECATGHFLASIHVSAPRDEADLLFVVDNLGARCVDTSRVHIEGLSGVDALVEWNAADLAAGIGRARPVVASAQRLE
jgi:hypothetical protein